MKDRNGSKQKRLFRLNEKKAYYAMGLITGLIIGIFLLFIINPARINSLVSKIPWVEKYVRKKPIYLSQEILQEIKNANGIIDYAYHYEFGNITDYTFTKIVDNNLKIMKPNLKINGYILNTVKSFNYLPPILYLPEDKNTSKKLKEYINKNTRISFKFSTDNEGHRVTVPRIYKDKKILIAGDSVAFGIGLNDKQTIASFLQTLVSEDYQVVNIGVGGYDFESVLKSIHREIKKNHYAKLVYIVCQNDFLIWNSISQNIYFISSAMEKINEIRNNFPEGIFIILVPYMFYVLQDIYLNEMPEEYIYDAKLYLKETKLVQVALKTECKNKKFHFLDFTDIANDYMKKTGTIWSRFALYNDYSHLSSKGARLLAERIFLEFNR